MPTLLSESARRYWPEYIELFGGVPGLLTVVDGEKIAMLCAVRDRWERLEAEIAALETKYVENPNGAVSVHPAFKLRDTAEAAYWQAMSEFGMGPKSRSGIRVDKSGSEQSPSRMFELIKAKAIKPA